MENIKAQIQQFRPELPITMVQLPDGENLNSMWLNYGTDGILELINEAPREKKQGNGLVMNGESKIQFDGKVATYYIVGNLPMDAGNMRISLQIIATESTKKHRLKIDLFETSNVEYQCKELSEKQGFDYHLLEADLLELTDLLEDHRDILYKQDANPITKQYAEKELASKAGEKAVEFLSKPRLLQNIDKLLEQSGIVGEEENRKLLFVLASSYKMPYLLHGLVQGSSGEGKSHLINSIASCMPQEDVMNMTRITSKSLYHYRDKELMNKLILIQDYDGLDEDAQLAFREMQTAKVLSSSTVVKDNFGNIRSKIKEVNAHFSSLMATTKAEIYFDNMSRSIVVGVDESEEQTLRIIGQQNRKIAGLADKGSEEQAKQLLRNCMRVLKSYEVINPFADKLILPSNAKMLRRLNSQFQNFVSQITLLHQYQRKTDQHGRLMTTKEDIKLAVDIFFSAIVLKVDELDGSTRQFFEKMKAFVKNQPNGTTHRFTSRDIRQALNTSKTATFKHMQLLQELEYINPVEGSVNRGFKYLVSYWDNLEKLKAKIKEDLGKQLMQL